VNDQAACDALYVDETMIEESLTLYPNPTKNTFKIKTNYNIKIDAIDIYSILGKLVYKTNIVDKNINISQLKPGIYTVKITSGKQFIIKKVVIN
jgi:hypothetical protein